MLACHPRRQESHYQPPSTHYTYTSPQHLALLEQLPQPSTFDLSVLESCLQAPPVPNDTTLNIDIPTTSATQYMSGYYFQTQNPAIRVHQSAPASQLGANYSPSSVLVHGTSTNNWGVYGQNGQPGNNVQQLKTPVISRRRNSHQRAPSSSSIGSSSSASTYDSGHATAFSYNRSEHLPPSSSTSNVDSSSLSTAKPSRQFSNHLPTPSHTPTQESFLTPSYSNYRPSTTEGVMATNITMRQFADHNPVAEDEAPGFTHSTRHSVSSYDSPRTPHTTHNEDFDEKFKVPRNGETNLLPNGDCEDDCSLLDDPDNLNPNFPKLERTMTDYCQDELYYPHTMPTLNTSVPPQQRAANSKLLSPFHNTLNQRLSAAHHARSQSPSDPTSRGPSPFRRGSPYAATSNSFSSPRLGTAAQNREQQKALNDSMELQHQFHRSQDEESQPKTISPKDALLEYHQSEEDTKIPLFPSGGATQTFGGNQYGSATHGHFDNASGINYGLGVGQKQNWSSPTHPSSTQFPAASGSSPAQSNFNFVPASVPGMMHGLPMSNQYPPATTRMSAPEQTPEFPAHLTSMESSASEAGPETSRQKSDLQKPAASKADTGTYTCTYHGCTLRFETPQKLQKHKREGHRQNIQQQTTGVGSGMTSAALLARNSQAGPHKCERINPTTGKPCNTVFSRPYDLTRHEDTIHNARKQKVRCALCVEEKTFSRSDALTRHMRVVHPDIDFPGKHRRRGHHD